MTSTDDDKVTMSRPVAPVTVAIIGTGDGIGLPSGTEAKTAGAHAPNIIVKVIGPLMAVTIRFINTFLTGLLGILTGAMASDIIPANDFLNLAYKCAGLAVAGACVGLVKDCVTIFSRLEQRYPVASGSV